MGKFYDQNNRENCKNILTGQREKIFNVKISKKKY